MPDKVLLTSSDISRTIIRLAHEIVERNDEHEKLILIGIRTRGVPLAYRLSEKIQDYLNIDIPVGALDITVHRDDLLPQKVRPVVSHSEIPVEITGSNIILVDDVIYTGRSVRAAMDALINLGRPQRIQLVVLVDRGHRELPIRADYVGKNIPTSRYEDIQVRFMEVDGKDEVIIRSLKRRNQRGKTPKQKFSIEALS